MAYSREIYRQALSVLEQRRSSAHARASALREQILKKEPRLREIENGMAASSAKVVTAVLAGGDVQHEVDRIRDENLALQQEQSRLLASLGLEPDGLEPHYFCRDCGDTGYCGTARCHCFDTLLRELSCQQLSELSAMEPASFDSLDLNWYSNRADERTGISPRARMREVIAYCRAYAADFNGRDNSLLLRGPTGVGKTHLSLAIAGEVLAHGYSVVYGPAQQLLHRLEKEHFGRAEGNSEDVLQECDLLILDDVGTEFSGPFYVSALYNIINGRMLADKPTIISTNLTPKQMTDRYGEAIVSRVTGTFCPLLCDGKDIRLLKLKQSLKND